MGLHGGGEYKAGLFRNSFQNPRFSPFGAHHIFRVRTKLDHILVTFLRYSSLEKLKIAR